MTVEQLITDTSELIQALTQRFEVAQLYIAGFSFGGTIAALTAARHPELVRAVVCVDLDVQFDVAERVAYDFALEQATRLGNKRAIRELRTDRPTSTPGEQNLWHAGQVGDQLRRGESARNLYPAFAEDSATTGVVTGLYALGHRWNAAWHALRTRSSVA